MRKQLVLVAFLAVGLAVVAGLVAPSAQPRPQSRSLIVGHLRRAVDARRPDLGVRPVQAARRRGAPGQPLLGRPERRRAQEAPGERAQPERSRLRLVGLRRDGQASRPTTRSSPSSRSSGRRRGQARRRTRPRAGRSTFGTSPSPPRSATAAASIRPPTRPPCRPSGYWVAWNEPNNPVFLKPQFTKISRRKYRLASPRIYAGMCNAIMSGVHLTGLAGEKVACGVTAPRGNNTGTQPRAVGLTAHLPARPEAGPRALRRLRAPPVLPASERVAAQAAARAARGHAREHQRAAPRAHAALRQQAPLDHRVRLPDEPARSQLRRLLDEAGARTCRRRTGSRARTRGST